MIDLVNYGSVRRLVLVAALAAFSSFALGVSDGSAEQCKDNERTAGGKNSKALTKIVNNSGQDIKITLVRRISTKKDGSYAQGGASYTDETKLDGVVIKDGEDTQYKVNVSTFQENRVQVQFNGLGTSGTYCEYSVRTGDNYTHWSRVKDKSGSLVDCYGVKALDVCDNCGISCERSFGKGKDEWKTTFTITAYN